VRTCVPLILTSACNTLSFAPVEEDDEDTEVEAVPDDTSTFGDTATPGGEGETGAADDTDTTADTDDTDDTDSSGPPPTGSGTVLSFRQYVSFWSSYLARGSHRVLVGPDDGSSPYGGTWVVVLDDAAMEAEAANATWTQTSIDLGPTLASKGWTSFRVGFAYLGTNADSWYLDDVCIGAVVDPADLASCTRLAESFDALVVGDLPTGWESVAGPTNVKRDGWSAGSTGAPSFSPGRSVARTYSSDSVEQVLVVPVP
jgi:hypothetical protein